MASRAFHLRAPEPSERDIQRSLVDCLRRFGDPTCLWLHIPNERRATAGERVNQWKLGLRAGAGDMLFVHRGRVLFQELKRHDGIVTANQAAFAELAKAAGAEYEVPRSLDQAIESLQARGIIMRNLLVQA